MYGLIRYGIAGFLWLVVLFAAFSPCIAWMHEKHVNKEDISLATDAGMEKKTSELKELLPQEAFINNNGFQLQQPGISFVKAFAAFRQPHIQALYARIPTPPPRITAYK
ncbi:hypothetical protein LL912_22260 [Niabella sp. CC-SYL272]|uniref:hypothetical protein n=1 Tax=Niabella agricola TaxID=2891571 RepID=UPI001F2F6117|nr:hypothetical protein [Niabella agricola]MCF3111527.1 hypothetical protein [Niabella agricola]